MQVSQTRSLPAIRIGLAIVPRPVLRTGNFRVFIDFLALHGSRTGSRGGSAGHVIEQGLGALSGHHAVGNTICVPLVRIVGFAHATLQVHARTLLDDVRRLVRRSVKIRGAVERNEIAGRERLGSDLSVRLLGGTPGVSAHAADVMPPEQALDRVRVGEWFTGP